MARPKTGSAPTWNATTGTFWARLTLPGKGRTRVDLGTDLEPLARARIAALIAGATPETVAAPETFAAAAERVSAQRETDGVVCASEELARVKRWANPIFGMLPVGAITTVHVNAALDRCKGDGRSKQTAQHLLSAIRAVYVALGREQPGLANPADGAVMPRFPKTIIKQRSVLTDEELIQYLGWRHPDPVHDRAVRQRQIMSVVARCFGGLRTHDLHSLRWESSFEIAGGEFPTGWAPRKKSGQPQRLIVPAVLRPFLRTWWQEHGCPVTGPLFPQIRGASKGAAKGRASHAKALRRDLRRAFGIEVWTDGEWRTVRPLSARETELLSETPHTLPVDFHSWRRAYAQALEDAGVTAQAAMALTGHSSLEHARYLVAHGKARSAPEAALPRLPVAKTLGQKSPENAPLATTVGQNGSLVSENALQHQQVANDGMQAEAACG